MLIVSVMVNFTTVCALFSITGTDWIDQLNIHFCVAIKLCKIQEKCVSGIVK